MHVGLTKEDLISKLLPAGEGDSEGNGGAVFEGSGGGSELYGGMTVKELRKEATEQKIRGRGKMNKAALISALKSQ